MQFPVNSLLNGINSEMRSPIFRKMGTKISSAVDINAVLSCGKKPFGEK